MKLSNGQVTAIEAATRAQSESELWMTLQNGRLTTQQKQHAIAESALMQNNYRHYINSMSPQISEIIQLGCLYDHIALIIWCLRTRNS